MNVMNGWENSSTAFPVILLVAAITAGGIYGSFFSWVKSNILEKRLTDEKESTVLDTVTKCLKDVDSIETVMRSSLALNVHSSVTGGGPSKIAAVRPLDRQMLQKLLSQETKREVRQEEIDFIFAVMDQSNDGWIGAVDWKAIMEGVK